MVIRYLVIFLSIVLSVSDVLAISADDLRNLSADTARAQDAKAARANTSDPAALVPDTQQHKSNEGRHFRRAGDETGATDVPAPKNRSQKRRADSIDESTRSPQARSYQAPVSPDKAIVSDAVTGIKTFGIRLGTWMEGNINRNTSSAEPGLVEIYLAGEVIGDRRTLKAGTLLFADKQINGQTKRLEMVVQKGITPNGEEFKITGLIFDPQKVSGLTGIISVNNDETLKRGAGKGLLAGLGAAAQNLAGQTPVGAAVGAGSQSILQDKSTVVDQATEQKLTIYVSPQPVLIRVEKTF